MALQFEVDSLDSIPEGVRDQYVEAEDGKFRLDLDGYEDPTGLKSALDKERSEKRERDRQLREMQKRYDGIDPDKTREMLSRLEQDEESKLIAEGKMDEVINQRTERMRAEHERQLTQLQQEAETAKTFADKFRGRVLSDEVRAAASEVGLIDTAARDAYLHAQTMFQVDDEGNVVAKEEAGFDANGKPLTLKSWLESMRDSAPHWFPVAKGGGAPGSNGTRGSVKRSAMSAEDKYAYIQKHGQKAYLDLPS
ncbi:hypothetical protein MHM84_03690 [Halomonas sp. McH1-25]|uniref:hypothetical protein n=1 Tax=unclassified Halomonas TaxID=2609666 RepID=UPI001EF6BC97|nr:MULTISPECIES: hypothetical protein [unclassified Halomonas]MCG7598875.1 hypothetical protein [Halomonas sp. McH1-25]MCP1340838.1 hypothetical protein [Halomonas sp. FL8]MCP1361279.1 hypothetical protein [Halomonas sp. BBD45]MCP1363694.1 hypothetical protein [Halomonas sp. BBD48]